MAYKNGDVSSGFPTGQMLDLQKANPFVSHVDPKPSMPKQTPKPKAVRTHEQPYVCCVSESHERAEASAMPPLLLQGMSGGDSTQIEDQDSYLPSVSVKTGGTSKRGGGIPY